MRGVGHSWQFGRRDGHRAVVERDQVSRHRKTFSWLRAGR
jgi:hypothetical protein